VLLELDVPFLLGDDQEEAALGLALAGAEAEARASAQGFDLEGQLPDLLLEAPEDPVLLVDSELEAGQRLLLGEQALAEELGCELHQVHELPTARLAVELLVLQQQPALLAP